MPGEQPVAPLPPQQQGSNGAQQPSRRPGSRTSKEEIDQIRRDRQSRPEQAADVVPVELSPAGCASSAGDAHQLVGTSSSFNALP
eukprot:4884040-Prymnesium_polylepis.1